MADWLKGKGMLLKQAQQADNISTPLEMLLRDAGNGFLDVMRGKIDEDGVNAGFAMRQGLAIEPTSDQVQFTSEAEYTQFRNDGVSGTEVQRDTIFSFKSDRPSYAMVQSIEEWMRAKGFVANAWAVATNVLKHGYEGAKFIENTFTQENMNTFEDALLTLVENNVQGRIERVTPNFK